MNWSGGIAVGVGVGYMNAAYFGIPAWANIIIMAVLAIGGELAS